MLWPLCTQRLNCCRQSSTSSPLVRDAAGEIFKALVEAALREACRGATEDESEGEAAAEAGPDENNQEHEALTRAAVLGRAALPQSLTLLGSLLHDRVSKLTAGPSQG